MDKKQLSERDIISKYITPAIVNAGWDLKKQIREEVTYTDGRIIVRRKLVTRGERKRVDIILYYKSNIPIAIIEAKDNKHSIGSGMQQALGYANSLDVPFVYSSNGDGFLEHDKTAQSGVLEKELSLDSFPSPQELWNRYKLWKELSDTEEQVVTEDYYFEKDGKSPRYYQRIAINRTVEAVVKGQNRIILVMATGTGKTYTAFQIIWRLWKSKTKKRILYLADRNIIVNQTRINDFKPFGEDIMTKINRNNVDKAHQIYFALYQSLTGNDERESIYEQFSKDFFDLIIIDECHRGSAREDSAWREVLDYFGSATKIGLTATPKETKDVSNTEYFGDPIYTYSLKQGIEDGFLAPYKVIRVLLDIDVEGYRPEKGKKDKYGYEIDDREYNIKDYESKLVVENRTEVMAKKVSDYLKQNNSRFAKTIFFCVDINHAERMRMALINENADLVTQNAKYVMQITGDNEEGKAELDNFIAPESPYPVLVTTSKLMTTGVDTQTCQFIILCSNINSPIEFKQIIGRGTRIVEEYGKLYFTIIDFTGATKTFADPSFNDYPIVVKVADDDIPIEDDETPEEIGEKGNNEGNLDGGNGGTTEIIGGGDIDSKPSKYIVNDVLVKVLNERVYYYDKDGKLITETLLDYTKNNVQKEFKSLDDFLNRWKEADQKKVIVAELEKNGVLFDELNDEVGKDLDPFDLICHVAFDKPALTRKERANNVKKRNYFTKYLDSAREVLEALLEKYADQGLDNLESMEILKIPDFKRYGSPIEIVKKFGGKAKYLTAIKELEEEIYTA